MCWKTWHQPAARGSWAPAALRANNRIHTLHPCHDLTSHTLLTRFYIEPAYERTLAPRLLSRARRLFIAEFAERFCIGLHRKRLCLGRPMHKRLRASMVD